MQRLPVGSEPYPVPLEDHPVGEKEVNDGSFEVSRLTS